MQQLTETSSELPPRLRGPKKPVRLAYLVTHPIQYQAPLLKRVAEIPNIRFKTFFQSDFSTREYRDTGFDKPVKWDVDLLAGYEHEVLPSLGPADRITPWSPFSYGLSSRLRREKFDVLWIHGYSKPYYLLVIAAALALGLKVLVRDEATVISRARPRFGIVEPLKKALLRSFCRAGTGFLAIGSMNRDYWRKLGIPDSKIFSMPYCVDNSYFQQRAAAANSRREVLRAQLELEADRKIILFASKFQKRKRPDDLLGAYDRLRDKLAPDQMPYLLLVGDGELRAELEKEVADKNIEHVRFLGFQNQSQLPGFFDLCDVFILPSIDEPWGLVVNEVMNAGKAVIVSDAVGCWPDLVRNGENGFVVPVGDRAALAQALLDVLAGNAKSTEMAQASKRIIDSWSFDQDLDGLVNALDAMA